MRKCISSSKAETEEEEEEEEEEEDAGRRGRMEREKFGMSVRESFFFRLLASLFRQSNQPECTALGMDEARQCKAMFNPGSTHLGRPKAKFESRQRQERPGVRQAVSGPNANEI